LNVPAQGQPKLEKIDHPSSWFNLESTMRHFSTKGLSTT